jgi:putative membrane protein
VQRTGYWVAALALLLIDLCSPIGTRADTHLADHMVEHMVMWLVVAPLLAAAAPMRLALFALAPGGRRRFGRALRSAPARLLTSPAGSVVLFGAVVVATALPAVYAVTERNDWVHVAEHALYLATAMLVWAPVVGADPIPHRAGPRGQAACMLTCMVPMALVSVWLLAATHPVYSGLVAGLGGPAGALHDQRIAGLLMLLCGPPAFAVPLVFRAADRRLPAPLRPELTA